MHSRRLFRVGTRDAALLAEATVDRRTVVDMDRPVERSGTATARRSIRRPSLQRLFSAG